MEIQKRAESVISGNWRSKLGEHGLKYFDLLKKNNIKSAGYNTGTELKEILLKFYNKRLSLGMLKFLRENIMASLEKIIKTVKLFVERTFLRYKWINKSHFLLASLVNVLYNSAQISDPVKKIEKLKQKGEYTERVLKNYKNTLYKKYKSINLQSEKIDQIIQKFFNITILIQEELIKINKKYNRKQKIRSYLLGILNEINPFTK